MIRTLDILLAGLGLTLASPLLLACAIVIRATSQGPAIFRQTRVGQDRKPFTCLKLRTMRVDTPSAPSHELDGLVITSVGRFLRRTKLDEIPQLLNVLHGEMSLVGPRPCLLSQSELIEARRRLGVDRLRPGITGPAQILGLDMSQPRRLAEVDAQWLRERSVGAYAMTILLTLGGRGLGADRAG